MEKVIITNFTDPLCTWCWGEEPIFRKIETHYGDQVEFRFVMGGLVEDFGSEGWPWGRPGGGGMPAGHKAIGRHWAEASEKHGMPSVGERMDIFDEEHRSSYPLNIAVKAAQIVDPVKAPIYLHRLREASAAQGLKTTRDDVLISLASEVGLDVPAFIAAYRDGPALKAFGADKNYALSLNIHGFPTCIVQYGEKSVLLNGYNTYETFVAVINELSQGKIRPHTPEATDNAILELLKKYRRLAPEEIRQAFDFPDKASLHKRLNQLALDGKIRMSVEGNGHIVALASTGCDGRECAL